MIYPGIGGRLIQSEIIETKFNWMNRPTLVSVSLGTINPVKKTSARENDKAVNMK